MSNKWIIHYRWALYWRFVLACDRALPLQYNAASVLERQGGFWFLLPPGNAKEFFRFSYGYVVRKEALARGRLNWVEQAGAVWLPLAAEDAPSNVMSFEIRGGEELGEIRKRVVQRIVEAAIGLRHRAR